MWYGDIKKKYKLSIIIEIKVMSPCAIVTVWVQENLSRPIRRFSRGKKKRLGGRGLYSYSLDRLESGLQLNSDISKESGSISVLKSVPKLSDEPVWVEENQLNKPAFGELTGYRARGLGALNGQPSPSWLTPSWGLLQREIVTGHEPGHQSA